MKTESDVLSRLIAGKRKDAPMVEFPQPMVEAPEHGSEYYYAHLGRMVAQQWDGDAGDLHRLSIGVCYAKETTCTQRIAYDAQEMARLVIPAWFRKLGPDVEILRDGEWTKYTGLAMMPSSGWAGIDPKYFRSKPRDVVVTVNGVEYRWPETVKAGDPAGPRFRLSFDTGVYSSSDSTVFGDVVHHTRAGAQSQLAAIRAAAGLVL